jgi:hypothetical protein
MLCFRGGNGTNGADGGNGGTIRIYVDENKTHLLQAVDWDVQGGKGGVAGHHGKGGRAGKGGRGGRGLKWFVVEHICKLFAYIKKGRTNRLSIQMYFELLGAGKEYSCTVQFDGAG